MEFVEGKSLREVLAQGRMEISRIGRLTPQLTSALAAIHEQGICHRDLKPENVLIRNEGTAREELVLIDFSIAIIKNADETLHGLFACRWNVRLHGAGTSHRLRATFERYLPLSAPADRNAHRHAAERIAAERRARFTEKGLDFAGKLGRGAFGRIAGVTFGGLGV